MSPRTFTAAYHDWQPDTTPGGVGEGMKVALSVTVVEPTVGNDEKYWVVALGRLWGWRAASMQ